MMIRSGNGGSGIYCGYKGVLGLKRTDRIRQLLDYFWLKRTKKGDIHTCMFLGPVIAPTDDQLNYKIKNYYQH